MSSAPLLRLVVPTAGPPFFAYRRWLWAGCAVVWVLVWWLLRPGLTIAAEVQPAENPQLSSPERPSNLLLISVDTLRADHLSCYGYFRQTSPTIDALARRGRLFTNAFATASHTGPSHMSLFTSQYPFEHGVTSQHEAPLAEATATLAEVLQRYGYATAAFVSMSGPRFRFGPDFGFARGFQVWEFPHRFYALNREIRPWLEEHRQDPFFLFVHAADVHEPHLLFPGFEARRFDPDYQGPVPGSWDEFIRRSGFPLDWPSVLQIFVSGTLEEYNALDELIIQHYRVPQDPADRQHLQALYDAQLFYADRGIGRLLGWLDELQLADRTLVVLTADHGQEFGEHGRVARHEQLYDEVLHVPLIIQGPGVWPGPPLDPLASSVDIMPTILELLGLPVPDTTRGTSLRALLQDDGVGEVHEAIYADSHGAVAVRTREWKWIRRADGNQELYHLVDDPGERENVLAHHPKVAADLRRRLDETLHTANPDAPDPYERLKAQLGSQGGYW